MIKITTIGEISSPPIGGMIFRTGFSIGFDIWYIILIKGLYGL
tara:strand:+ start:267 stop:395 length:129 start_codon:yes stop_codon:yes gene_type:complete